MNPSDYILYSGVKYLWLFSMELPLCHPSGTYNFEMAPRFSETFCTLDYIY
jgi:hypothetical protein